MHSFILPASQTEQSSKKKKRHHCQLGQLSAESAVIGRGLISFEQTTGNPKQGRTERKKERKDRERTKKSNKNTHKGLVTLFDGFQNSEKDFAALDFR
jgi:hypothetical protein